MLRNILSRKEATCLFNILEVIIPQKRMRNQATSTRGFIKPSRVLCIYIYIYRAQCLKFEQSIYLLYHLLICLSTST